MRIAVYAPGAVVDRELVDVVVVPPGLPAAPTPEALEPLRAFARAGGKVLGLADGVAWLCAAALLPGDVAHDPMTEAATHVRVQGRATPFTWAIPAGRIVPVVDTGARARLLAPAEDVAALEARGRIVLRYCDVAGGLASRDAAATVAGLCDDTGHVLGILAPSTATLDGELGRQLLSCLRGR